MKLKFIKLFCGITLFLFACTFANNSAAKPTSTYSAILYKMDVLVSKIVADEEDPLAQDNVALTKGRWASAIIDSMTERGLTVHWRDEVKADSEIMLQIFNESREATSLKYPWLKIYLDNGDVIESIRMALGL